jgi:hypothetical protein
MARKHVELVMDRHQRAIVGTAYPLVIVALAVVPWLVTAGDLPRPIATHFAADGKANGSLPVWGEVLLLALLSGGSALALAWLARRPTSERAGQAPVAAFVGLVNGTLWLFTALANRGHEDWHDVRLGAGAVAGPLVGSVAATLPIVLLARHQWRDGRDGPAAPALRLAEGERAAWFGGAHSYQFLVGGTIFAIVGLVAAVRSATPGLGLTFVLVGVAFLAFASVSVSVTHDGVRVRSGRLGWPAVRFSLDGVASASHIEAKPLTLGGWGYRGSVRVFGRASWILRGGEALQLDLVGGGRFVVTVDGATEAAAVVNAMLVRATSRRG